MNRLEKAFEIYKDSRLYDEWPISQGEFVAHLSDEPENIKERFFNVDDKGCAILKSEGEISSLSLIVVRSGEEKKGVGSELMS